MLYLDYMVPDDQVLLNPGGYFNIIYDKTWFEDSEIIRIACTIDKLEHIDGDIFNSSYSGRCSGKDLSGGAKTVILAYLGETNNKALPLSWLGENCFQVLGSLDVKHNIVFNANSTPLLMDFQCTFRSLKTGKMISHFIDCDRERIEYVYKVENKDKE